MTAQIRFYSRKELLDTHHGWKSIMPTIRTEIDGRMAKVEGLACKSGCNHCCYLTVQALPHEIMEVVDYVRFGDHFTREARATLLERLRHAVALGEGLDPEAYRAANIPCAFLGDNGLCAVYPVRPVACRSFGSTNVHVCDLSVPDDMTATFKVVPDSLLKLLWSSGLFFTGFLKGCLAWWEGGGVQVPVTEEEVEQVRQIQHLLDRGADLQIRDGRN